MVNENRRHCGFAPVARPDARRLILGSLPGVLSIQRQQYYAHPRNLFWPIIGSLLGFDPGVPYDARVTALHAAHIALWDVCASAHRAGSLDTAIRDHRANDFGEFLARHPRIDRIFFNGRKAAELYARFVVRELPPEARAITATVLASTSPANASIPLADKRRQWQALIAR